MFAPTGKFKVLSRVSTCLAGRFVSRSEDIDLLFRDTNSKSTIASKKSSFDLLGKFCMVKRLQTLEEHCDLSNLGIPSELLRH
jgi:hypothetical protein